MSRRHPRGSLPALAVATAAGWPGAASAEHAQRRAAPAEWARPRWVAEQVPGMLGTLTSVRYGMPARPVLSLVGGRLADAYYIGSMSLASRVRGGGYISAEPRGFVVAGYEDVRVLDAPAGLRGSFASLGMKFRLFGEAADSIQRGTLEPRLGFGFETAAPYAAVRLQLFAGPEYGPTFLTAHRGATELELDVRF